MNFLALADDVLQIIRYSLVHDLRNLPEMKRGLQASGKTGKRRRPPLPSFPMYGLERTLQTINRKANRVRELFVKQQKLDNALRTNIGCIDLAIGFKRGTGAQQANPLQILIAFDDTMRLVPELMRIDIQQRNRSRCALQVAAQLDEVPALAMAHG